MFADIRLEEIAPNPNQPRKFFDEAALTELTASIEANGLLQPLVVRPYDFGSDNPATFMIVAGERRFRALQASTLVAAPAQILENISDEQAFVLAISENVNREDMTILEEAGAYADLAALSWSPKKIAAQFGKTETHIKWRLGLLTLRDEVAKWVDEGKIKPNLAWHIAQLSSQNQIIAAMRYLRGDFDSEAEATNFAQGLRMAEQQTSLVAEEAPSVEEREKRDKVKKATSDKLSKVEEVLMPMLDKLTESKPDELADILGAELGRYVRAMDRLANQVTLARRLLRQANGIAQAREVAWSEAVKAVAPADAVPVEKKDEEPKAQAVDKPEEPKAPAVKETVAAKPAATAAKPAAPKAPAAKKAAAPKTTATKTATAAAKKAAAPAADEAKAPAAV